MRTNYLFEVKHPKGLVPSGKAVGISQIPQHCELPWGDIHASSVGEGKATIVDIIVSCTPDTIEKAIGFIARKFADAKIPASWDGKDGRAYGLSLHDPDGTIELDDKDIELLKSQGFEFDPVPHFNPKAPRTSAPRYENTETAKAPKTSTGKVKRGDRPTLSSLVDAALLGDGTTKAALIDHAAMIYTEKTRQALQVTITSLISTSAGRHGKRVVKSDRNGHAFYKLEG